LQSELENEANEKKELEDSLELIFERLNKIEQKILLKKSNTYKLTNDKIQNLIND